eukprot:g8448.t1
MLQASRQRLAVAVGPKAFDRTCGALIGLACGDAVGTTSEFKEPGTFPEIRGMVGGGVFKLQPGQWTDDTSLALCLAQSLIERAGHDPRDQLERYLGWFNKGRLSSNGRCFDVGNSTEFSLQRFRDSNNTKNYCGGTHPSESGNGSLMRLAPAPMLLRLHPELAVAVAGETSRTTLGSVAAVDSCRYYAGLLVGAMNGAPKEHLLAKGGFVPDGLPHDFWSAMQPPLDPEVAEVVLRASYAEKEPPIIRNNGYVVRTLEAALWAFGRSTGFEEGCLLVANLGDDSDTVAAVYGQLAGAFYGMSGIPSDWRDKLALKGLIESMAEELFDMSKRVDPCPPPPPPPTGSEPSAASMEPSSGGAALGAHLTDPSEERVTRFMVKPGVGSSGDGGRTESAYWAGGVAAHYQRLEDEYVTIKAKVNKRSHKTLDAFDQDVRAMFPQKPDSSAAITFNDLGDLGGKLEDRDSGESQGAVTEEGSGGEGCTSTRRKKELGAEFVARLEVDRASVESVIRARDRSSGLI